MTDMSGEELAGSDGPSRRTFIGTSIAVAAAPITGASVANAAVPAMPRVASASVRVDLTVNGEPYAMSLDPRTTLLDALREHAGLTGTKKGCDHGQCGACTVHVGGRAELACLTLAIAVHAPVRTIEGVGTAGQLDPLQLAFIDHDAFQCGYCTPGQIMSGLACLATGKAANDADLRDFMSGNLCRCAAYPHIAAAIRHVRDVRA